MEAANVTTEAPAKKSGLPITELLVTVAIGAAIYLGVLKGKGFEEGLRALLSIGMAIVGIGLLIFIHELGHFLAAKWCGVKVEAFALGIGPLIPALSFKRGETSYGIAWFPIGGYVKMLGQVDDPNDKSQDAREVSESPHSYKNKTVGQRMLIISAGVIMNILLGFVLFIIVYFFGKDEVVGKIGTISPGSPAEKAGLQAGSELLSVAHINNPWYNDLNMTTALASPGTTEIPIKFRTRDGQERDVIVIPKKDKFDSRPSIGVTTPTGTRLHRFAEKGKSPAHAWHPAGKATFLPSDVIMSIQPDGMTEAIQVKDGFDIHLIEHIFRDKKLKYQIKRAGAKPDETILLMVEVEPSQFRTLGLRMTMGPIVSLSESRPAIVKELQVGDLITAINGDKDFDPLQLPDLVDSLARADKPVVLQVKRADKTFDITVDKSVLAKRGTWMESSPVNNTPMAFPALGFSYSVGNVVAGVTPGSPADKAGIKAGETIKKMSYENKEPPFKEDKIEFDEQYRWPFMFVWMQDLPPTTLYTLTVVNSSGTEQTFANLQTVPDPNWFFYTRGLQLEPETRIRIADNIWDAIVIGARESYRFVGRIYLNLYSLLRGNISVKLLNGPLGLAEMTYRVANIGLIDLLHLLMSTLNKAGFIPVITPDMAKVEVLEGIGFIPRGPETQIYSVENTDLCLVATAEITLGGLHMQQILDEAKFPLRYVGLSHCFRTEAGAPGRDTRGLYRVHQFTKVEMFAYSTPEQSEAVHLEILGLEEAIFQGLGIPYQVIDTCTGDLGGPAYRKYDLEAWMPGRGTNGEYGEVTSTSNCTDYQSRRLNIRSKAAGGKGTRYAHTLNGTAVAITRAIIAILENNQQADGSVIIPEVLRPFVGKDRIVAKT